MPTKRNGNAISATSQEITSKEHLGAGGVRCISNAALIVSREGGVLLTNLVKFITVGENELDIG